MSRQKFNIFMTGATGFIGQNLQKKLVANNHEVLALKRSETQEHQNDKTLEKSLNPKWMFHPEKLQKSESPDVIIHLAGENIAAKRWSTKQKAKIYNSRISGTQHMVKQILSLKHKPHTFFCASAIGYYGNRGNETLTEESIVGNNFSAKLCSHWEQETLPLIENGIRVVNLRFGIVLSHSDGALKKMLLPFKLGLGGSIGDGQQHMSWITIKDAVNAILFLLETPDISGPVNMTSPYPVSNKDFSKTLAQQLNRPSFLDMPAFMCRLLFGEMADELLLSGQYVLPEKLMNHNFQFSQPKLSSALSDILK